jgi:hypothetical protein
MTPAGGRAGAEVNNPIGESRNEGGSAEGGTAQA